MVVAVGGTTIVVGGTGINVGGSRVLVGGKAVSAVVRVLVGADWRGATVLPQPTRVIAKTSTTPMRPILHRSETRFSSSTIGHGIMIFSAHVDADDSSPPGAVATMP
jgi:hypothetical protein